ncbi:MAG TPA: aldo/keto reductase [Bryobacteraceae bacterium]|nr:aldo/keto reductase [Bryobacteraceae bacterium]
MEYAKLKPTDLAVSRVCLGTAFRGEGDEATCIATIRKAADLGCTFLDCANAYRNGLSEQLVGRAVKGNRDRFVVATKVGAAIDGDRGLSQRAILRQAEASLKRLQTDYIDLYLCHFPDPQTPLEETLLAMDELVRQGKVRHIGCSSFPTWQLWESLYLSGRAGSAAFVCNQVQYNLLDRRIEDELMPFCAERNISITVFAPTAIGLLSGRFRRGQPPPQGTPWALGPYNYQAAMTKRADRIVAALVDIAGQREKTPIQVTLAWCLARPEITSVIIGADTPEQAEEDLGAVGWRLSSEETARLDKLSDGMRTVIQKDAPGGYKPGEPWPEENE